VPGFDYRLTFRAPQYSSRTTDHGVLAGRTGSDRMRSCVRVERGSSGRRYAVSREYDASPAAAWALLANTEHWSTWGASVSAVRPPAEPIREGLTGEVQVFSGPWVPFELDRVDVNEAEGVRRWTWSVARIPATGHRVEGFERDGTERDGTGIDGGERGCRVVFEVPLLAGGYVPVCQRALDHLADALESE
jgi:hypothetical protein